MTALRILAFASFVSLASPSAAAGDDAETARLIRQLGSNIFMEREEAQRKLEALGESIRVALQKASSDPDAEISRRAAKLVRTLDDNIRILRYDGHTLPVFGVTFTPDGKQIVSASFDNTIRVVDIATGKLIHKMEHFEVLSVAVSPDGKTAISTGLRKGQSLRLWDLETGRELKRFTAHTTGAYRATFSSDGKRVVFGGFDDETVRWLDLETGRFLQTFRGHVGRVHGLALSADGKTTLSSGHDRTVRLWDNATGNELKRFTGHTGYVWAVALSPDGTRIASGGLDVDIRLWDVMTGKEIRKMADHNFAVHSLAFSPDGKLLASANYTDHTVSLWDPETGTELRRYKGHTHHVYDVAFSPDGKSIVSSGQDSTVRVWRVVR